MNDGSIAAVTVGRGGHGGLSLKASRAVINGMAESTRMEDVLLGYPRAGPCPQTAHLPATPAFTHA